MPIGRWRKSIRFDNATMRGWLRLLTTLPRLGAVLGQIAGANASGWIIYFRQGRNQTGADAL